MKRCAIIVNSPLPSKHSIHLRGASEDAINKEKFLLSSNGGGWRRDEVIVLSPDPSLSELKKAIDYQGKVDYAMTFFSGHGYRKDGKSHLLINEREAIHFKELFVPAKWNLLIMDACRKDYPAFHATGLYGLDLEFEHLYHFDAREIYERAINKVPYGTAVVFSTSENEYSWDTQYGGAYTVESMSQTINWINQNSGVWLPLGTAFERIKAKLINYKDAQRPQLLHTCEEMRALPFATNPKVLLRANNYELLNNPLISNRHGGHGKMTIRVMS